MAKRKNIKRIDPRYFLNEKRELTKEEIQVAIKEIAEDDPSEWGQNISSYFDEVDAHRKLSQVLEIDEEELKNTMDQMGLSIVPAEEMGPSTTDQEYDRIRVNQPPEYSDEHPLASMEKLNEAGSAPDIDFLGRLHGKALWRVLKKVDVNDLYTAMWDEEHPQSNDIIHNIYGAISSAASKALQDKIDGWYSGQLPAPSSDDVVSARQAIVDAYEGEGFSPQDYEPGMAPR